MWEKNPYSPPAGAVISLSTKFDSTMRIGQGGLWRRLVEACSHHLVIDFTVSMNGNTRNELIAACGEKRLYIYRRRMLKPTRAVLQKRIHGTKWDIFMYPTRDTLRHPLVVASSFLLPGRKRKTGNFVALDNALRVDLVTGEYPEPEHEIYIGPK